MDILLRRIEENLNKELVLIAISNPRKAEDIRKYLVRPVLIKDKLVFQMTAYTKTQAFHENLSQADLMGRLTELLPLYKQVSLQTARMEFTGLINKKGKAAIRIHSAKKPDSSISLAHNRTRKYILKEGRPVAFMQDLGVMTAEGRIVRTKYDKFRQVNRFLEFIEDIYPALPKGREICILDFGCGKSYLTFAVYYYLHEMKGLAVRIIGLDLKKDVIRDCKKLADQYGYEGMEFYEGSIEDFEGVTQVDMVITLHACDTATDYALYKAICWGARVILSVPCCQHELNRQLSRKDFAAISDYGILKDRFAALATDGIRADLLEASGYDTQILEFIDMEHTPKNLLIRAVKRDRPAEEKSIRKWKETEAFCQEFHFDPTLKRLLKNRLEGKESG